MSLVRPRHRLEGYIKKGFTETECEDKDSINFFWGWDGVVNAVMNLRVRQRQRIMWLLE
jgi:hypothetical protein